MRNKFLGIGEPGYHPLRKIRNAYAGIRDAVIYDASVAYKLVLSIFVLTGAFALRAWVDFLIILLATGFVIAMEIVNSAIEALCDFVETRHNEKIRVIKDMAAAAAGVAILVWLTVLTVEISEFARHWVNAALLPYTQVPQAP